MPRSRRRRPRLRAVAPSPPPVRALRALLPLAAALAALAAAASGARAASPERALGLTRYRLERFRLDPAPRRVSLPVELDGRRVTLRLERASLRRPGFRLLAQRPDGSLEEIAAPEPRTYRGAIPEIPGAIAGGSIRGGGLSAALALPDGRVFHVEPARDPADPELHVVYLDRDAQADVAASCAVTESSVPAARPEGTAAPLGISKIAEIAFDADFEFYQQNGSSIPATVDDVEAVLAGMNVVFERDCSITHRLTLLVVRSSEPDPYSATAADALYGELRTHWNTTQVGVPRDLVHLMTGKNLDGSTIGYAGVGVVCNRTRAYGISQSRYSPTVSFSRRVALTAHEVGHNWNADHCDAEDPCHIMCSSINGCDGIGLPSFEPAGANAIMSFAAGLGCLETPMASVASVDGGTRIALAPPHPSPSSGPIRFAYRLERAGAVRLEIFDVRGQRVATLVEAVEGPGWHTRTWDGRDRRGVRVAAGVFYARLESAGEAHARRVVVVP